ncbi:unnamed protein product [Rotaria sordida]|uniref:DUF4371 domain-containing protein n=1 Tax=Rotaria sordida TaxID=392033 RepID=A0A819KEN3_9BILA|nr:unnamed protein product [Rotaria sordida]CAF1382231.1 unnamed protein product [Rotaria sordida]CAF3846871.1 unnamed protein product [Rotaria sordida]CAF3947768.1 unnamed protein product [Rotaria sordida]
MIDESTDMTHHQQVSLVIRYTDDQFNVYERFVGFERASDTSDEDIKYVVEQCFDRASSMRGPYNGVASRISQTVPIALYVHYNGHILILCLVDVSEAVVHVRNSFGIVKSLYNLIEASPKRHTVFEDLQKEAGIVSIT